MGDAARGNAYKYDIEKGRDATGISIISGGDIKKISQESRELLMEMSRHDSIHLGSSLSSVEIIAALYYIGKVVNGGGLGHPLQGPRRARPIRRAGGAGNDRAGGRASHHTGHTQQAPGPPRGHPAGGGGRQHGQPGPGPGFAVGGLATALKLRGREGNVFVVLGDGGELDEGGQVWERSWTPSTGGAWITC